MALPNALYSPYGAFELKRKYQFNFLMGTVITASFVALILITAWIIANIGGEEEILDLGPSVVIKTVADLGPPPSIAKKPPQVKVDQPQVAAPKVGIPTPVADDEVIDEDVVLATRDELAEIVAPDITTSSEGGGDIVVDIQDDDYLPSPTEFVPVEIYPEMIHYETPPYPRLAQQAGIEGVVHVKALVDKTGNVRDAMVAISSGTAALDEAAVEYAYKNKFKPGIQNGRPIAVWVTYKVNFEL
ncbi:MAG: energy transducer TonB [Candidatus Zixiibacteriota bacterium]|nr:MAG: energy transducer TonB [candidate division Zixibacteria bacterium]